MDFVIGFFVAISSMTFAFWLYFKGKIARHDYTRFAIKYSQSHIHHLVFPLLPKEIMNHKKRMRQSIKHDNLTNIRVIIMDNSAYWIKDNTFYVADMSEDGTVNKDTTRVVDTMAMNKVQLEKMVFIVDKLTEGLYDDSGSSGN